MSFGIPYALLGLLALVIPILIHLFSERENKIIPFGSITFLKSFNSESARSIKISRLLLLLSRISLIGLICLLMAEPWQKKERRNHVFWVEEGIIEENYDFIIANKVVKSVETFHFKYGKDNLENTRHFNSAWSFVDFINDSNDSITVYSFSKLKDFSGQKLQLKPHVSWVTIPMKSEIFKPRFIRKEEIVTEWKIESDRRKSEVISRQINWEEGDYIDTTSYRLRLIGNANPEFSGIFKGLIEMTSEFLVYPVTWSSEENANWTIVIGELDDEVPPKFIQWIPGDHILKMSILGKHKYRITGNINREEILQSNLPVLISSILNKDYTSIKYFDNRVISEPYLLPEKPKVKERLKASLGSQPISILWWLILIPVFCIERILSHRSELN